MRVRFDLNEFDPFTFGVDGVPYELASVRRVDERLNQAANIDESVCELPNGKTVKLTVVGDEDQNSIFGFRRGWYVVEILKRS